MLLYGLLFDDEVLRLDLESFLECAENCLPPLFGFGQSRSKWSSAPQLWHLLGFPSASSGFIRLLKDFFIDARISTLLGCSPISFSSSASHACLRGAFERLDARLLHELREPDDLDLDLELLDRPDRLDPEYLEDLDDPPEDLDGVYLLLDLSLYFDLPRSQPVNFSS